MKPLVSVVIPTRNRAALVKRAIESSLAQTLNNIEVIVVIDGPDQATQVAIAQINDPRLRMIQLPASKGGSFARNTGVTEAKAQWVAFLDDDDEWFPQKLELQFKAASKSNYKFPVVTCSLIAHTPRADYIWPKRLPSPAEPISEYLLARNSLFRGEGSIQTSTFFTTRELLIQNPFNEKLLKHQDTEWVLRVNTLDDVKFEFLVDQPLVIHYIEDRQSTVSSKSNWHYSLTWIQENKHLVTPRAYAGFILTHVSPEAAEQGDRAAFFSLLKEAIRFGEPKPINLLIFLAIWLIPRQSRRRLRDFFTKRQQEMKNVEALREPLY